MIDDPTSILCCCNNVFLHDAFSYKQAPSLKTRFAGHASEAELDDLEAVFDYPMVVKMPDRKFQDAGIGRKEKHMQNNFVRTDEISWITGATPAGQAWLDWTGELQRFLNRELFLGLFSFESHFAHYTPGDFYKKHLTTES